MNAQKRDLVAAAGRVTQDTGERMLCAGCGVELNHEFSCYCQRCEREIYDED